MKALIWFLSFLGLVVVQVIIKNMGFILGGIPTMILFGITWWIASTLSRKWEGKHGKKEIPQLTEADLEDEDEFTPTPKAVAAGLAILAVLFLLIAVLLL